MYLITIHWLSLWTTWQFSGDPLTVSSHLTIDIPFIATIRSSPPKPLNQPRMLNPAHVVSQKARASTNPDRQSTIRWVCSITTHPVYGTQLLQPLDIQRASSSGFSFQLQSRVRQKISLTMNIQRCHLKVQDPSRRWVNWMPPFHA